MRAYAGVRCGKGADTTPRPATGYAHQHPHHLRYPRMLSILSPSHATSVLKKCSESLVMQRYRATRLGPGLVAITKGPRVARGAGGANKAHSTRTCTAHAQHTHSTRTAHAHAHAHEHAHAQHAHAQTQTHMHTRARTNTHTRAHTRTNTHVQTHTYKHTQYPHTQYPHTHMNTRTHHYV